MFRWTFVMKEGTINLPDDGPLYTWGYLDEKGFRTPGRPLVMTENEEVELTIANDLRQRHNFSILGTTVDRIIDPGRTETIRFTAPAAGTYIYGDTMSPIHRALGLCGGLISKPAEPGNIPWLGGPVFDRQYLWLLTSIDANWNLAVQNAGYVDTANHHPAYFFINGLAYPEAMKKISTPEEHDLEGLMIHEKAGSTVLVRVANAGLVTHVPHRHGFQMKKIAYGRTKLPVPVVHDSIIIKPGATIDLLLTMDNKGEFTLYDHVFIKETTGEIDLNGALAIFKVM